MHPANTGVEEYAECHLLDEFLEHKTTASRKTERLSAIATKTSAFANQLK